MEEKRKIEEKEAQKKKEIEKKIEKDIEKELGEIKKLEKEKGKELSFKEIEEKKAQETEKMEKRVKTFLIIITVIIVSLILVFMFKNEVTDIIKETVGTKFNYHNFKFEKFYFGEILMYKTALTVYKNNQVVSYDLILRNDPRELEKEIQVPSQDLKLKQRTFLSLAPGTDECNETILAAWETGEFLGAIGKNNSGAVTDINQLKGSSYENETERVKTCKDAINETVIILQKSQDNETKIYKENENCFILSYKECETVKISERFILYVMLELSKT